MDSSISPGQWPRRLRPIKRACVDCHARKVRCDGAANGFPCSNCRSADVDCIIAERRKRKRATDQDINNCVSERPAERRASTGRDAVVGPSPVAVASRQSRQTPSGLATPGHGAGDEDQANADVAGSEGGADYSGEYELAKQHLVDFFSQDLQDNPIRARSTYVGNELSNLNYLTRQRAANQHVYHYPCSNIYVPREFRNSQTLATPNLIPKDAFVLPPRHVSDVLVADYFAHIHPTFPIIDRDGFLSCYHDPNSSPSILLLHAVCLAGSHVTRMYRNNQDLKVAFFRRAKALLDGRYEEDRMNVVQAALLLTWFSDGGDDICANAWWWIGLAARTAIGLGMHREVEPSKMPVSDKRLWRMIWWCLVQFDCLVSLSYGRPQNINLDDSDVPPLQLDDFDPSITEKQAQAVMHHTKLCATVSELVRSHFSVKAAKMGVSRKRAVEAVDGALADWLIGLPHDLRDRSDRQPSEPGDHSSLMVHLTYNTVLVQFHRSLSSHGGGSTGDVDGTSDDSTSDREICAEAASNLIRIFERLSHNSGLRHCWFWAPNALFTAMLEVGGQIKCSNPILALRYQDKYESGLRSLRRMTRYWLFATSVLRLFESNSIKSSQEMSSQRPASSATGDHNASPPENGSPLVTVNSVGALSSNAAAPVNLNQDPSQQHTMDWVQLLSYGDPNAVNMHVERNRWQNSIEEWQSLYWSDPLDNIRLDDSFGQFQYEWRAQ